MVDKFAGLQVVDKLWDKNFQQISLNRKVEFCFTKQGICNIIVACKYSLYLKRLKSN